MATAPQRPSRLDPLEPLLPHPDDSAVVIDSDEARRQQTLRAERLNVIEIPALRALGLALLALAVLLHNRFILQDLDLRTWITFSAGIELYALISWLTLRRWYAQVRLIDLGFVFLMLDTGVFLIAVYVTGGEQSWIFLLMLFRVIDQVTGGVRRVLFFAHYTTLAYVALLLYLAFAEGRDIQWVMEYGKVGCLYVGGLYIAFSARGPELRRQRAGQAIRIARTLIQQLDEQSHELKRQSSQLEASMQRAESASAAKSAFVANMSHELRTPLTSILGLTQLAVDSEPSAEQRERLQTIMTSATSLLSILNDVLVSRRSRRAGCQSGMHPSVFGTP